MLRARAQRVFALKPVTLAFFLSLGKFSSKADVAATAALNIAVITGTTRNAGPPRPILGPRVANYVISKLEQRGNDVTLVDPREIEIPLLQKPHFAYAKSQVPSNLKDIHDKFLKVDAFVTITPEYNHAPSPALINVLNHFGSSTFSFKPSAIISYSSGQWGGTRAASALRPILSELGCLPVSAMVHIPNTAGVFDEDGSLMCESKDIERWHSYFDRCFSQLEWWGDAAKNQKMLVNPFTESPSFSRNPSERNAPS
mmetsp:Transcript_51618/g.154975  ORF Transcript_51618/g.154975 Transcript_51618/m.154975 type:complete len:256 (-) Transcript_51618:384-1151(-)|eukprot:CAMPEP_0113548180 /NCGR_PEP_ID=MMETSP0015_2-20120614/12755_1 /TAXON_ID=2838 /ORGANISM="Odontella" /LENGTH=255 /DNA_ID=CAMNT_0000448791 /DNA_START=35 /DNA_END=802 /DNA_ORIENTATION=+ /assembly_acc=CAM_ASM_000160